MRKFPNVLAMVALLVFPVSVQAQQATMGVRGNVIDASGTVTTGGTSQQVLPANTGRYYLMCQNPVSASEVLFVNFGSAASTTAGSYELAAGASLTFDSNFIPAGAVNVNAVTTGHRFVCKQG
jgi:hypothetical protein